MPIFPPTSVWIPAVFKMWATSEVVVVFAVRAGDGDELAAQESARPVRFRSRRECRGRAQVRARADSRERPGSARSGPAPGRCRRVAARRTRASPRGAKLRSDFGQLRFRLLIRGGHACAVARRRTAPSPTPVRASPTTSTRFPCRVDPRPHFAVTSISKSSTKTAQTPAPQSRTAR